MSVSKLPPFWINPVYRDGTHIDDQLIEAALEMWPEAARIALREGWLVYDDPKILSIDQDQPMKAPPASLPKI